MNIKILVLAILFVHIFIYVISCFNTAEIEENRDQPNQYIIEVLLFIAASPAINPSIYRGLNRPPEVLMLPFSIYMITS